MQHVVVVYDITSNKRRKKVGDILEGYGKRVNRSVFECKIKTQKQRLKLEEELAKLIDIKTDSLRIYTLCVNCIKTSSVLADEPKPFDSDAVYFF